MTKKFILLMDGMMGSGKTTTANKLAEMIPRTAVLSMDRIKWSISDFERGHMDNSISRDVVFAMAKAYLGNNISLIVEHPISVEEEQKYSTLAEEYSANLIKVQLFAKIDVAYSRIINRQKERVKKVPEDRIRKNLDLFKNKSELGYIVIDTTNASLDEPAKKILSLLKIKSK